jgi:hypothetical protein
MDRLVIKNLSSSIIENLAARHPNISHLHIEDCRSKDWPEAVETIIRCLSSQILDIGFWVNESVLTENDKLAISRLFKVIPNLEIVDFRRNETWSVDFVDELLLNVLSQTRLRSLNLKGIALSPRILRSIQSFIAANSTLEMLNISDTRPSRNSRDTNDEYDAAVESLRSYLRLNSHKTQLYDYVDTEQSSLLGCFEDSYKSNTEFLRNAKDPFRDYGQPGIIVEDVVHKFYNRIDDENDAFRIWVVKDSRGRFSPIHQEYIAPGLIAVHGFQSKLVRVFERRGRVCRIQSSDKAIDMFVLATFLEPLILTREYQARIGSDIITRGMLVEVSEEAETCLGLVISCDDASIRVLTKGEAHSMGRYLYKIQCVKRSDCSLATVYRWGTPNPLFLVFKIVPESFLEGLLYSSVNSVVGAGIPLVDSYREAVHLSSYASHPHTCITQSNVREKRVPLSEVFFQNETMTIEQWYFFDFEARKIVVIPVHVEPQINCFGQSLILGFFSRWAYFDGLCFAEFTEHSITGLGAKKRSVFLAPAEDVLFLNYEKAIDIGLVPFERYPRAFVKLVYDSTLPSSVRVLKKNSVMVPQTNHCRLTLERLLDIPTLGEGLSVRDSLIPNSGRGLFASRTFEENEAITLYCGHKFGEIQRRWMQNNGYGTHCKPLEQKLTYLDGLKNAFYGMPVAQLTNHSSEYQNAKFVVVELIPYTGEKFIVLKAIRRVISGQEFYVDYGQNFWAEQVQEPEKVPQN